MPGFDEVIEPDEASGSSGRRSGMFSGFGVASAVLAVVALSVAVLISVMWSGHRAAAAERSFQARSMQAAAEWTGVLINMNADNVEENLQRLRDGTVGELNSGFDASIAPYRDVVTTLRSRTTGDVESVSIEQIHRDPVAPTPCSSSPPR
jgi:hypothetical protein